MQSPKKRTLSLLFQKKYGKILAEGLTCKSLGLCRLRALPDGFAKCLCKQAFLLCGGAASTFNYGMTENIRRS